MGLADHHRQCAQVPRRGVQVSVDCCQQCGGWCVTAYSWSQDGDACWTEREAEFCLGPFDTVTELRATIVRLLEELGFDRLTPWASGPATSGAGASE